jgi:hypothetical protein
MLPTNVLTLTVEAEGGPFPLSFPVRRVVNAGYVGRDRAAVQAHIDELAREGVPPPASVPVLLPLTSDSVTTAERIEVLGPDSSGEIEYVLLVGADEEVFVAVGSDHTDRALERTDLGKSKQICKNVISRRAWRFAEVRGHWDDLVLSSWVRTPEMVEEALYQQGPLSAILSAGDLLELVSSRINDGLREGLVIFSGTVPLLGGRFVCGDYFRGELLDSRTERRLGLAYHVERLAYLDEQPA